MEKLAEGKNFLQDWKFATNTDFNNNLDSPPSLTSSTRRCVTFNCRKSLIFPDNLNFTNFFDYPQDFFFLFSVFSLLRSPPELYTVFFHKAKAAPTRNLPVNHQHQRAASTLCEFSMIFPSLRFSLWHFCSTKSSSVLVLVNENAISNGIFCSFAAYRVRSVRMCWWVRSFPAVDRKKGDADNDDDDDVIIVHFLNLPFPPTSHLASHFSLDESSIFRWRDDESARSALGNLGKFRLVFRLFFLFFPLV